MTSSGRAGYRLAGIWLVVFCLVDFAFPVFADDTNIFLASPSVSYQYQDGALVSATASYQYQDGALVSATVSYVYEDGGCSSPTVSYQYLDADTSDFAGYLATGETALLSKPIICNGNIYQVVGITASAVPQGFGDLFDPATYLQPPASASDPSGGVEPAVIGLSQGANPTFLVRCYSNGVWQICADDLMRAWVYHLSLAEVQAHYRASPQVLNKGVYSAQPDHYEGDLHFRDTEWFWFPTCWPKYAPFISDAEQYKYRLAAYEQPLQDYVTYGVGSFFNDKLIPLQTGSTLADFTAKIADGSISTANVLNFDARRWQYFPPALAHARQAISAISTAWDMSQDLQAIFVLHSLDTDKVALMSYLHDKAMAYHAQGIPLDSEFLATLDKYVDNNANLENQAWDNLENKIVAVVVEKAEEKAVDRVQDWIIAQSIEAGYSSAAPVTIQGVTLSSAQVLGIEVVAAGLVIDFVANPEGVYEQRIVAHYGAKNAVNWEKMGTKLAQEIDGASSVTEQQADAYLLVELMEREIYGNLDQNLVAATDASFAGGAAAGWASLLAPDQWRWTRGTAEYWKYINQHWNDVVRGMMGRTRQSPAAVQDLQPPVVEITSPVNSGFLNTNQSPIAFSGTATDDVGVVSVNWASSSGAVGSCTGTTAWHSGDVNLNSGTNTLTVSAFDASGKIGQAALIVVYTPPDQLPPSVAILSPSSSGFFETGSSNVTISAKIGDDVGVVSVDWMNSRTGSGACLISGSFALATNILLLEGDNPVTLTAHDASGKSGNATLTVRYISADTTPPIVSIVYPVPVAQFTVTTNVVTICGTASDAGGVASVGWTNSLGGSGACNGTASWVSGPVTLSEGDNLISVSVTDFAGNIGSATILLTYHVSAPQGAVAVQFGPPEVVANRALWQLDLGAWHFGSETVSGVSTGIHFVNFSQLIGYRTPTGQSPAIQPGVTSVVSALYWNNTNTMRLSASWVTNGLALGVFAPIGYNYQIEASANLSNWMPFTNFMSTNPAMYFRDIEATNYNWRFYRAVLP